MSKWPQWHKLFEGQVAVDVHGWSNGRTVQPEHECWEQVEGRSLVGATSGLCCEGMTEDGADKNVRFCLVGRKEVSRLRYGRSRKAQVKPLSEKDRRNGSTGAQRRRRIGNGKVARQRILSAKKSGGKATCAIGTFSVSSPNFSFFVHCRSAAPVASLCVASRSKSLPKMTPVQVLGMSSSGASRNAPTRKADEAWRHAAEQQHFPQYE